MKKIYLITICLFLSILGKAQETDDYAVPQIVDYMVSQRISADGTWIAGQDVYGALLYRYNTSTKEVEEFESMYTGIGNCVSNTGIIVGQDFAGYDQHAAVVIRGRNYIPPSLEGVGMSSLDGITPDGRRAVGYLTNLQGGVMYIPFYCNISASGIVGDPQPLPYPTRDVTGSTPYVVKALWISDDGNTIAGLVTTGSGFYEYPIIFQMNEKKEWSYKIPSALTQNNRGMYPFMANMALSADGKTLFLCQARNSDNGPSTVIDDLKPYVYDIENDILTEIETDIEMMIPIQILGDGSLLAATYYRAFMPLVSYIKTPDSDKFIKFTDYVMDAKPEIYPWLEDTLGEFGVIGYDEDSQPIYGEYIITGNVYVSSDLSVITGGYSFGDGFSYIFTEEEINQPDPEPEPEPEPEDPPTDGIQSIGDDIDFSSAVEVYDITGRKVLQTINKEEINYLPKGIYIVNGKKIKL